MSDESIKTDDQPPEPLVLVLGLDPYRVPGPWDPQPVADGIARGKAAFSEHGLPVEFCLVGLDGSDDVPAVMAARLRARRWECVVIGGGVRTEVDLLEMVMNLVHQHAPGAAIAFTQTPADTYDSAARALAAYRPAGTDATPRSPGE